MVSQGSFNALEFSTKQAKIQEMKRITAAGDDACCFYLEAADWNIDVAVREYYGTTT
jgi:hypothetical protein